MGKAAKYDPGSGSRQALNVDASVLNFSPVEL